MSGAFTEAVYARIREGCQASARAVVPHVWDLVRPATVVDVGGGEGWWAREFAQHGPGADCLVLDASIEEGRETEHWSSGGKVDWRPLRLDTLDALDAQYVPLPFGRRYDLAVCLEVAEHLAPEHGDALVNRVCQLADVVLWSAAIPHQGGHGHVNEQWPQYWADRFHAHNYVAADIRDRFWDADNVEPWYRQNLLIFGSLDADWMGDARLYGLAQLPTTTRPRALVHPEIYRWRVDEIEDLTTRLGARIGEAP